MDWNSSRWELVENRPQGMELFARGVASRFNSLDLWSVVDCKMQCFTEVVIVDWHDDRLRVAFSMVSRIRYGDFGPNPIDCISPDAA
jgi:hypothetical protein